MQYRIGCRSEHEHASSNQRQPPEPKRAVGQPEEYGAGDENYHPQNSSEDKSGEEQLTLGKRLGILYP